MSKKRVYRVWIIGKRISTQQIVVSTTAANARAEYANQMGLKTYLVDAVWMRECDDNMNNLLKKLG